jgi:hypothetical protein
MNNGSAGKKCDGDQACRDTNIDKIVCGICNGRKACMYTTKTISEGSCNDSNACYHLECELNYCLSFEFKLSL